MRVRTAMMSLKTKIIIAVTAVAVVAAAVTVGILLTKKDAYRVLKVFELIGSATVTREKTGDLDAYEGMNLESGDKVKVGSDSQMRLSLDGDKYILLDSDSLIELKATGSKKDSRTTIDLKKGSVLNEITSPLSENSSYEVNTPKATMAVRGTSFSVSVKKVGDKFITDINVFHGTVAVQLIDENGNKKGEVVLVTEGNCVTIITEPNKNSENDPTVDGYSYFVKRSADDENSFEKVGEGENPVYPSIYKYVSKNILLRVVSSDSDGTLNISQEIIDKILGIEEAPADSESSSEESSSDDPDSSDSSDDSEDSDETDDSSEDDSHRTDSKADDSKASSSSSASDSRNSSASSSSQRDNRPSSPSSSSDSSSSSESRSDDSRSDSSETDDSEPTVTKYTVDFVSDDGEVLYTYDVESGKTLGNVPEIPARTGYTGAWIIDGTNKKFTSSTIISSDMTVTAVYTINTYTVTFTAPDADDPTSVPADKTADYGTLLADILPEVPAKTGYSGEWKVNGTDEITASTKITADVTVTAVYTINSYTVTFTAPDADDPTSVPADKTADYGTLLADILPEVPTKTGYSGEWKINGTDEITASTKITADVTVTAVYTINSYTVTFIAPDADDPTSVPADITADYGTLLKEILPEVPTKTGYSGEWKIGGTDEITSSTKVTADIIVTAVYTINSYTVTFTAPDADNQNDVPADKSADYGTLLADILPEVPAKTGYSGEWKIGGTDEITASTKVTADVTVTAVYTINTYTVTFTAPDADDPTSVPADKSADYGTLLADILPEVPTKTGYSGVWKIDGKENISATTTVTADVTVTAVYTINTYTVTFIAPEADDPTSVPADKTADYGTLLADILPEVPAKTGYSGEWKIDGTDDITSSTKVTADITVTAVYTINSYTVTFTAPDADDPTSVPADITADYGTLLSAVLPELPEVPEKTGYDGEWLIDGKTAITDTVTIDGNMTITAVYTIKQFTVSYYDKSYTVNTIMADYNSGLLSVLESLKLENVSSDLSDPYVWTTYGYAWGSTLSGQIRADDTMKVTKDIDTSYSVIAYQKKVVTYYYMNDDGSYTEGGKFYVLSGECVADCDAAYLSSLLGTEYSEFLDDYGNTFDENTTVYMDTNIYAALADKTDPDSG